jgi:protoporphyrinogen oxidase
VAVLGAGVCGLYAARVLAEAGLRVTVLDQFEVVGGLAAGQAHNGNFYDLGVHQLHAFDHEVFADVAELMGDRLIPVAKCAKIRYGDGYRRYPLEFTDLLTGIPPWTLANGVVGLGVQSVRNRVAARPARNAEEALIQLYGRPLYGYFFRDFTHRYWGMPASSLSPSFVRTKMPRLSAVDVVRRGLGRLGLADPSDGVVESALARETLYYSPTGSRELPLTLAAFVRAHGGEVWLDSPVVGVAVDADRVQAVRYRQAGEERELACDYVISTLPLPALVRAIDPPSPPEVLAAADQLKYKAVTVFGLLVRRPQVLDAQSIYFRERIFHRVAEPKRCGLVVTPPDYTILLVETTCDVGDDRWRGGEATRRRISDDLAAEGLIDAADIVETHVMRAEHAYPVFELGFEPYRDRLLDCVAGYHNLWSTGRQGAFAYPNLHQVMRMGATAAGEVLDQLGVRP